MIRSRSKALLFNKQLTILLQIIKRCQIIFISNCASVVGSESYFISQLDIYFLDNKIDAMVVR